MADEASEILLREAVCKLCGATIYWGTNPETGKKIPVNKVRPILYKLSLIDMQQDVIWRHLGSHTYYQNHFQT